MGSPVQGMRFSSRKVFHCGLCILREAKNHQIVFILIYMSILYDNQALRVAKHSVWQ